MPRSKTTWKAGESGNPTGRPKSGESFAEALRSAGTLKQRRAAAKQAWKEAEQGNIRAMEFIRDTIDGKPAQRQIITGDPDAPVAVMAGPRKRVKK